MPYLSVFMGFILLAPLQTSHGESARPLLFYVNPPCLNICTR